MIFVGGAAARVSSRACCELRPEVVERLLGLLERDVAAVDELFGVELAHRPVLVDARVHQRLREGGLVGFVVTPSPVALEVDHDVLVEACRKANASRMTQMHASGSSPFTWKIGAWIIFATSVAYTLDRVDSGPAVKPIELFTTMWTVPPVR